MHCSEAMFACLCIYLHIVFKLSRFRFVAEYFFLSSREVKRLTSVIYQVLYFQTCFVDLVGCKADLRVRAKLLKTPKPNSQNKQQSDKL